ncbi:hypothetical protein [Flagellimonas aequoris]|uniref:Uncharacterized protein n=1 Tax=Flagellimonas aequoris TaxID=2306997 RepID=A0A418N6S1_9FLAO|nr:hypothetical protein [Allomuricauda aequoris]RIV70578.1 hypothetical protein D2U88_09405 [Allomuricauda aequoris]TXK02009.1 hypothetical protein FQ019_09330 [Allomuricauda aequoris]
MFQVLPKFSRVLVIGCSFISSFNCLSQVKGQACKRLNRFISESCKTTYEEIDSVRISEVLKYKVYYISQETTNLYGQKKKSSNMFIVIDDGEQVQNFEQIGTNTALPKLQSYIRGDFILNSQTAPLFQTILDFIYPIAAWKPDKREYFFKNGKWYFLRDAYFRSKQGFEISVDTDGKITSISYKMKWDEYEQS